MACVSLNVSARLCAVGIALLALEPDYLSIGCRCPYP